MKELLDTPNLFECIVSVVAVPTLEKPDGTLLENVNGLKWEEEYFHTHDVKEFKFFTQGTDCNGYWNGQFTATHISASMVEDLYKKLQEVRSRPKLLMKYNGNSNDDLPF